MSNKLPFVSLNFSLFSNKIISGASSYFDSSDIFSGSLISLIVSLKIKILNFYF